MEKTCLACDQPYVIGAKDPLAPVCFYEGICPGCARATLTPQEMFQMKQGGEAFLRALEERLQLKETVHYART